MQWPYTLDCLCIVYSFYKQELTVSRERAEMDHQLEIREDDVGAVMSYLASSFDQFRFVHFEANFLALPDNYPAT